MKTKNGACPSPAMPVAGAILFLAFALIAVTPETARAYGASLTCGDPTRTGHVEITIFICKDSKCRHGITVKKTVAIHTIDNAADKARKIRDAIRGEVERNGGTVPSTPGPVVEVLNENAEYEVEITKTKDDTGEPDISNSSYEGDPQGPVENLSFQTRVKLEGFPTEGLATFGENEEAVTVSTEGSTVEQIYGAWQAQLGGVIVSDGEAPCLALPPRSHPSSMPAERSFQYEVTDPGLSITVTQESLFDWRDAGPENSDIRLTLTNHGTLGFVDGTQTLDELLANIAMAQSIVCADGMLPADAPEGPLAPSSAIRLTAVPNPSAGSTQFGLASRSPGEFAVELFDAGGRSVRTLNGGWRPAGVQSLWWDGRDERGQALPAGTYFARSRTAEGTAAARVILAR